MPGRGEAGRRVFPLLPPGRITPLICHKPELLKTRLLSHCNNGKSHSLLNFHYSLFFFFAYVDESLLIISSVSLLAIIQLTKQHIIFPFRSVTHLQRPLSLIKVKAHQLGSPVYLPLMLIWRSFLVFFFCFFADWQIFFTKVIPNQTVHTGSHGQ